MFWVLLLFCPFWWLIDSIDLRAVPAKHRASLERQLEQRRACWVLSWLVPLLAMWLVNPAPSSWKWLFAFFALVRLTEIFTTGLGTILDQVEQVRARSLVTITVYAVQVTLIFAILYHSFASADFASEHSAAASGASEYLYISWSNVTSLGSEYDPESGIARFLAVATTSFGIFLLGVLLAFGINDLKERNQPKR